MSLSHRQKQRFWLMLAFLIVGYFASYYSPQDAQTPAVTNNVEQAYAQRQSDVQLKVTASVSRLLPDDLAGNRHQKFIIKRPSGLTILVAHNIDLAPKITNLKMGDRVTIFGEYEWSDKGGILHWTHHDPAKQHPDGWIEHKGSRYQ